MCLGLLTLNVRSLVSLAVSLCDAEKVNGLYMHGSHQEAWRRCDGVGVLCWWHCWRFIQTPPGCVRAVWRRRRVMECCARRSGLHKPEPSGDGLGWDWLQSECKRTNKCSTSLGSPSGLLENHFRWNGIQLNEKIPSLCKAVMCCHSFDAYNLNTHENKEKTLNEKVFSNFRLVGRVGICSAGTVQCINTVDVF